ncbi:MAG TPA: transketolase [Candidatus Diapherotrites archaeon]|uniref:Transketolase n=1 Tax=Candidatus Iainarchaeum sp. TaxID=3101447 RepID=A0A7J4JKY5_9ARCH|nr:transketolase [Candidatus Diapherotrites archaeon]HIH16577.1 transketolase [Candidatus Diapherotrites archaeon]
MSETRVQLIERLKKIAHRMRVHILNMTYWANSGHPGGSMSATDIVATLYFHQMKHDPQNPKWADRDRFVLSKGHCTPVLYAALAEAGYIPVEELKTFRQVNSRLQGHPNLLKCPGVEASTGTLGQGLSMAVGMALAAKLDQKPWRVYCMLGDGESQEGQIWEAAMSAAHYKLDNLVAILDWNKFQIDGAVENVMNIMPMLDKFKAFGWNVAEIDGHDYNQILDVLEKAESSGQRPFFIQANTSKGKGVSFTQDKGDYHGRALTKEEMQRAMTELGEKFG